MMLCEGSGARRVELGGRESDGGKNAMEMRKARSSTQYIGGKFGWGG
jgi:hypothetical protein